MNKLSCECRNRELTRNQCLRRVRSLDRRYDVKQEGRGKM
jgi:hypothetical protein